MTLVRSPFDVKLVSQRGGIFTFDVTSRYRVQRYEIISGDLDSAFDALAEEVRAGVASSGRMIPSYSAFDSSGSIELGSQRASVVGAALVAALGFGVFKIFQGWRDRARLVTGYEDGQKKPIVVTGLGGIPVEVSTASAFGRMRDAASGQGVKLTLTSGFRTYEEQKRLYDCYINCSCNDCHRAEIPGYSKHQNGRAVDINTKEPRALVWLESNAGRFGFKATEPGEPWHWERI